MSPDNRDGRRIDPSSSDASISYHCAECLWKNPSKRILACDRDTDEQDETNKKSPRPHVAEPMHRNQKMDLNRMIDTCLQTIKSGDTSSRNPGPVLLRLQGQDRVQPNTQGVRDHPNQELHRHTSGPIPNNPKKPPLSAGVAMSAMIPAPGQIIRTSACEAVCHDKIRA